ncbi:hypothetical protein ACSQB6_002119 [Escherichia coli]|nr:hypothetical protein [Escherichia coli]
MVISKTVSRDCGKAITHNTDVAHYRNTDRRRCLLTSLLVLTLPVGLCRQYSTHRIPG